MFFQLKGELHTEDLRDPKITETSFKSCQAVSLFLARFNRIRTMMTFALYHLARNPLKREKFVEEIRRVSEEESGTKGEINY